jgi:hypothetical protein
MFCSSWAVDVVSNLFVSPTYARPARSFNQKVIFPLSLQFCYAGSNQHILRTQQMPSNETTMTPRRPYSFGPLYDFLSEQFPDYRSKQNVFDVRRFAKDMGYAPETIYKAVRQRELLKIGVALNILKLSENQPGKSLTWGDLIEYILPEYEDYKDAKVNTSDDTDDLLS